MALGTAQSRQVRAEELGAWVWGKQIKGQEIKSGKAARYKNFGWKDRALYLREPTAKGGGKTVFSSLLAASACPLPTQAVLTHSFPTSPLYLCVYVCAHMCDVEVRGQPVEGEGSSFSPSTM